MKTIWKFPLKVDDVQLVPMPMGAEVLTMQIQDGQPCLWALVDGGERQEQRLIEIFGTGNPIHEDAGIQRRYIGTFQQSPFVWHVFERTNDAEQERQT
jgi:hypothetical protein